MRGRINMSERSDRGEELFRSGCNCSQAVVCAFEDRLGLDGKTLLRLSSSFGGGMGRLREVCGTVSGMFIVAGLLYGYDNVVDRGLKIDHYKLIQDLAAKFKEKNKYIVCRQLLGLDKPENTYIPEERTESYYKKRPCIQYVRDAIEILEEYEKQL